MRIERISLSSRWACALCLMMHTSAICIWCTFFIHAHGHAFPEACRVRTANEVFSAVHINLAFIRNVATTLLWVSNQARLTNTSWSVIYCLTNGTLSTDVTFAGVVAIILAVKYPLANSDGRAIVVPVAPFWLDIAPGLSVVWVSNEVLSALTDCDVVFRSTNTVLTTQSGSATWKTALDTIAVHSADLIVPAVAACATFGDRSAAFPDVISEALKARPAFAAGLVTHRDAVCIGPTAPVPARIRAVPNANPSQQANG